MYVGDWIGGQSCADPRLVHIKLLRVKLSRSTRAIATTPARHHCLPAPPLVSLGLTSD